MANTLTKGGNAALTGTRVELLVNTRDATADISALLLGIDGKVRSDTDLVFYNNPENGGVSVSNHTVIAQLNTISADVASVVIVVSADPAHPGMIFTTAPSLTIIQSEKNPIVFTPPDFTAKETVIVLAELYRRGGSWKVRAVGQGYASGLDD